MYKSFLVIMDDSDYLIESLEEEKLRELLRSRSKGKIGDNSVLIKNLKKDFYFRYEQKQVDWSLFFEVVFHHLTDDGKHSSKETKIILGKLLDEIIDGIDYFKGMPISKIYKDIYLMEKKTEYKKRGITNEEFKDIIMEFLNWVNEFFPDNTDSTISQVCLHVWENFYDTLTLQEVADYFFINNSYLSTKFKTEVNKNFKLYVNSVKIEYAKSLLNYSKYRIQDIAYEVGYKDVEYFSRVFKNIVGISPLQYRKLSS